MHIQFSNIVSASVIKKKNAWRSAMAGYSSLLRYLLLMATMMRTLQPLTGSKKKHITLDKIVDIHNSG